MSIYKRTIILICCTLLALMVLLNIISDAVYRKGFEELERQTVEKNVTQVTEALSVSLDALDTLCYDWAEWDDTYIFAQEYNQDYVDRNLQDNTFASSKISLFSLLNSSGKMVYSKAYDLVNSEGIHLPGDFVDTLIAEGLSTPASTENVVAGIMLLADQPMLVVSRPVLTSLGEGPIAGAIIIGRFLDSEVISTLSETTHLSVNLLPIPNDNLNAEDNRIIESLNKSGPMFIQAQSNSTIAGYTYVNDLEGRPAFIFKVVVPRDIYHQGIKAVTFMHSLLIFVGITFCIVFILLIKKLILSRLITLSNNVSKIGSSRDISRRVTMPGNDELSRLAININEMLMSLENTDKALRESEEKFRNLFEYAKDAIIIADAQTGILVDVNPAACQLVGLPKEKMVGMHQSRLHPPELAESYKQVFREHVEKGIIVTDDILIQRADGSQVQCDLSANVVTLAGKHFIQGVFRDVSERKQMEKAIRDSEEKFSKAFHASPQQIIITRAKDNITLEVNDSFTHVTGFSREETIGHTADELGVWIQPDDNERMQRILKEHGRVNNEEFKYFNKSGEIQIELVSIEPINIGGEECWISILTDITERKQMEESLADEATRRRILIEQSSDGIVILDQNGAVYEANRRFAEMLGYSPEEILKLHMWEWDTQWTPEQLLEMVKTVDEAGDHIKTYHRRKDGTTLDVEISTNGTMFSGQKLVFCVCRDISERNRMEKALRESEEKFSIAFRSSPAAVAITTLNNGKYIDVNDSYIHFTGYTSKELIGRSSKDVNIWAKPEDRAKLLKMLKEQGRVNNEEFDFRMRSGEIRTWLFSAEQINIAGESCMIGVSVDITDRKKAEEALREREKRFSDIAGNAMEWIWEVDTKGKYTYSSPVVEKILGYKPEELREKHFYDFFLPEEREGLRKAALGAFAQKQPIKEFINRNRCKNGKTVDLLTSGVPVIDEEGNLLGYRGVDTDITEKKKAEEALRESEEKFSIAFRSSPATVAITTFKDGRFIEVNDSYVRTTGYTRKDLIGRTSKDLNIWVKPEDRTKMLKMLEEQGRVSNEEFYHRIKSGEIRTWLFSAEQINIAGEPCIIGVTVDITERKRAEAALRESEEKFSIAFRSSPEMIIITDVENNKYLEINDSYINVTGYSREEMMGNTVDDFQKIWVKPEDLKKMTNLLQTQGRVRNEEFSFRMKSGEIRQWLSSADMVNIGGKRCMLASAIDITERKKAEEKLKEALVNLERSGKQLAATNKELEAFSYSVSHDLRSPLRSIDGFSQALLEDYQAKLDEKGQDYLRRLRGASQKMGELIDGILKLSRLTRTEMRHEPVDLSALADEIATRLQETQPKRRVKFVIDKTLTANGDPQLMRVLLENLLGNAWKFTSKKPQAKIEFSMDRNNGKKAYYIRDNGAGFDMTYADKLFNVFQRLHEATEFPGTGIGLATVKRIIHRHGGTIWAEGEVGKGATFYFTLD
jgi:PAS domain S-box-containing protein